MRTTTIIITAQSRSQHDDDRRRPTTTTTEQTAQQPPMQFGGFVCPLTEADQKDFRDEADRVRAICLAERRELETRPATPAGPCWAFGGPQLNEVGVGADGWQLLSVAIDSGAAETIIPHRLVGQHPIKDTEASRNGKCYASATGQPIPNLGEQRLPLVTQEGTLRGMTFQAAPVAKALGSVKRMCSSGHIVVFEEGASYVLNLTTGEVNWIREESGNYMLDVCGLYHPAQCHRSQVLAGSVDTL